MLALAGQHRTLEFLADRGTSDDPVPQCRMRVDDMHVEQDEPALGRGRREEKLVQLGRSRRVDAFDRRPRLVFLAWRIDFVGRRRAVASRHSARRLQQRMAAQFAGDHRQVAREPLQDPQRRPLIMRKPLRNRDPRGNVHGFEHRQSELGIVALLVRRMAEPMDVEIREDAQERRTHVDPLRLLRSVRPSRPKKF